MTIRNAAGARAAKAKGHAAEQAVCDYLSKKLDRLIERRRLTGEDDTGDIAGWPERVVEVKSTKKIDLPGVLAELEREIECANRRYGTNHKGFACIKRKGTTDVGSWYAVVPMRVMVELMR